MGCRQLPTREDLLSLCARPNNDDFQVCNIGGGCGNDLKGEQDFSVGHSSW